MLSNKEFTNLSTSSSLIILSLPSPSSPHVSLFLLLTPTITNRYPLHNTLLHVNLIFPSTTASTPSPQPLNQFILLPSPYLYIVFLILPHTVLNNHLTIKSKTCQSNPHDLIMAKPNNIQRSLQFFHPSPYQGEQNLKLVLEYSSS